MTTITCPRCHGTGTIERDDTRRNRMIELRKQGLTLQQIADQEHITSERVRQIVGGYKLPPRKHYRHFFAAVALAAWKQQKRAHGTTSNYTLGCRCDACRAANTRRLRAYRAQRREASRA